MLCECSDMRVLCQKQVSLGVIHVDVEEDLLERMFLTGYNECLSMP